MGVFLCNHWALILHRLIVTLEQIIAKVQWRYNLLRTIALEVLEIRDRLVAPMILVTILLMHDKIGELPFLMSIKEFHLVDLLILNRHFWICAVAGLLRQAFCRFGMLSQIRNTFLMEILHLVVLILLSIRKLKLQKSLIFIQVLFCHTLFVGCFFLDRVKTFQIFVQVA